MPDEADDKSPDAKSANAPKRDTSDPEAMSSVEALKKGMGLLWRAAQTAADEIQREVETAGVKDSLRQAGQELEMAAKDAARALEQFVERSGPRNPKPDYTDQWPPEQGKGAKQVDADVPKDGGTDEHGKRRDVRIQLDDD